MFRERMYSSTLALLSKWYTPDRTPLETAKRYFNKTGCIDIGDLRLVTFSSEL